MTTIAWDRMSLVADSQLISGHNITEGIKIFRLKNREVAAIFANFTAALHLLEWYTDGADAHDWPAAQQRHSTDYGGLVVAREGRLWQYECSPVPCELLEPYAAFGSGREYALGAMAMGADARLAVKIAARFDPATGGKIRAFSCSQ
jgi:hypothetical protein